MACCPARDVRAHLALQYLSDTLIGLLSVCRSKQVLPPGALAQQACAEVHKDPFTFSTLLEAQASGAPCTLMHACIHACVALCVLCILVLGGGTGSGLIQRIFFFQNEHLSASIPSTACVFKNVRCVIRVVNSIKTYLSPCEAIPRKLSVS